MARIKRGKTSRRSHKKVLKLAKGYRQQRSKIFRRAQEAVLHADQYSFMGRKLRKRDFRALWITRISQAVKKEGLNYSQFINLLKKSKIEIDRKIMANFIVEDPTAFKAIIQKAKKP